MNMWSWAAEVADGRSGAGVSDDGQRAMDAAGEWMLANGAATAVLEQVRLGTETADLSGCYRPAGLRLVARVRNGRVTWVPAGAQAGLAFPWDEYLATAEMPPLSAAQSTADHLMNARGG